MNQVGAVLIVEEDAAYRWIVVLRLQGAGIKCHEADTHVEALRQLSENPEIKVVIVDHDLRGSGPATLIDRLRKERPDVVIVGHSNMRCGGDFAAAGVNRFLLKPWTPDQLKALLAESTHPCG